jgi:hypothetical protein
MPIRFPLSGQRRDSRIRLIPARCTLFSIRASPEFALPAILPAPKGKNNRRARKRTDDAYSVIDHFVKFRKKAIFD